MPLHNCPSCGNLLTREEYTSGDCPACRLSVRAGPLPPAPGVREEVAMEGVTVLERPLPKASKEWAPPRPGPKGPLPWFPARVGLFLVALGSLLAAAGLLGGMLIYKHLIIPSSGPEHIRFNLEVFSFFGRVEWVGVGLAFVGMGFCLRAPAGRGPRGWALSAFCCMAGALAVYWIGDFGNAANTDFVFSLRMGNFRDGPGGRGGGPEGPPWNETLLYILGHATAGLVIGGNVLFGLFLWQLARHRRRPALAGFSLASVWLNFSLQAALLIVIALQSVEGRHGETHLAFVAVGQAPMWVYLAAGLSVLWFAALAFWTRAVLPGGQRWEEGGGVD